MPLYVGGDRIDVESVGGYLFDRGIIANAGVFAEVLSGGVSNDVIGVRSGLERYVVKQALARLRVAAEWSATRSRILTEADALRFAGFVEAQAVPALVDLDQDWYVLVMTRAPGGAKTWKDELLAGVINPEVAGRLGTLLGGWHASSYDDPEVRDRLFSLDAFVQLRTDPYYRSVVTLYPDLAAVIGEAARSLLEVRRCLVHGDFSPKNVLVFEGGPWVIDWEVAHFGNPVFDLAFLICHLRCKAIHRPADLAGYRRCVEEFVLSYEQRAPEVWRAVAECDLVIQTACLLLARVDGKSPVEYFDACERARCRALARRLLLTDCGIDAIWEEAA